MGGCLHLGLGKAQEGSGQGESGSLGAEVGAARGVTARDGCGERRRHGWGQGLQIDAGASGCDFLVDQRRTEQERVSVPKSHVLKTLDF